MFKKILILGLFVLLLSGTLMYKNVPENGQSELTKENIEALACFNPLEWWNRKDYDCVKVMCDCIVYEYISDEANKVKDGTGHVAHTWECKGCGDCGFRIYEPS